MPKKTKKEKIAAEYHRRTPIVAKTDSSSRTVISTEQKNILQNSYQFVPGATPSLLKMSKNEQTDSLIAIRYDIKKTLIIAFIAIAFEFALYWYTRG